MTDPHSPRKTHSCQTTGEAYSARSRRWIWQLWKMAFEYFIWTVEKLYEGKHLLADKAEEVTLPPVQINEQGFFSFFFLKSWG